MHVRATDPARPENTPDVSVDGPTEDDLFARLAKLAPQLAKPVSALPDLPRPEAPQASEPSAPERELAQLLNGSFEVLDLTARVVDRARSPWGVSLPPRPALPPCAGLEHEWSPTIGWCYELMRLADGRWFVGVRHRGQRGFQKPELIDWQHTRPAKFWQVTPKGAIEFCAEFGIMPPDDLLALFAGPERPAEQSAEAAHTNGKPASPPAASIISPRWDRERRTLTFDGREHKLFAREAPTQFMLLDAFEVQGWPRSVPNPYPSDDEGDRLAQTRRDLNAALSAAGCPIRVGRDNQQATWRKSQVPDPPATCD
jgi:hypothetical protein